MEHIAVEFDDAKFDHSVHGRKAGIPSLQDGADLAIYVKRKGTDGGEPAAVITFTVLTPDGKTARAQSVTTLKLITAALTIIEAEMLTPNWSVVSGRDLSLLGFFECDHLPPELRAVAETFKLMAKRIASGPKNEETTTALRKLLEAKDCAVRAILTPPVGS